MEQQRRLLVGVRVYRAMVKHYYCLITASLLPLRVYRAMVKHYYCLITASLLPLRVCRAMVKHPKLLLLDEPTHGLSGDNRERLLGMLTDLADDPSVSMVGASSVHLHSCTVTYSPSH